MDRSMTRYRHDINKMIENNEISTGPGRWTLGVPNAYGNAAYMTEPTIRLQKWGASHDMSSTKTDVESDLWNLARPTTKVVCGQYSPEQGQRNLTPMKEESFPEIHARLVDPPCTGRATGWNRWNWLYENPQENVSIPFEWALDTRHANKDTERHEIFTYRNKMPPPVPTGVPVPRQPVAGDVTDFNNNIPGASQRQDVVPVYKEQPRGYSHQGGNPIAPPFEPSNTEKERATTGRITTPQWFTGP